MNYLQALFSIFNAPLFATFIIGMFWKRMTPAAGFWGLVAGTVAALVTYIGYKFAGWFDFGSDLDESFWGAGAAFIFDALVTVLGTMVTRPKPREELQGLVWGMVNVDPDARRRHSWWESPGLLGAGALAIAATLTIIFF
jgi:solute:Na+ symporter, SSS family